MNVSSASESANAAEQPGRDVGLREVAKQLEGMFLKQLFQAMRESAPEGSTATARTSNDFFGGMMDEHLAEAASSNLSNSLGEAIYRQLVGLTQPASTSTPVQDTEEASK